MKRMLKVLASGMGFSSLGLGGLLFTFLVLPVLWLLPGGRNGLHRRSRWFIHRYFRGLVGFLSWAGIFRIRERALPPREQLDGTLLLATHPGYLDVVILLSLFDQLTCVVKGGIWNNPLFGRVVRAAGYISSLDPAVVIEEGAQALARGEALLLFPEGTRTLAGQPYVFQRGAAHLALKSRAQILPIQVACQPPLLAKGHRWHMMPVNPCDYDFRALAPLTLPWAEWGELPPSQVARQVTAWLEERFNQEIHGSGHHPTRDEAVHRQDSGS